MWRASLISLVLWSCDPSVQPLTRRTEQELTAQPAQPRVVWLFDNSGSLNQKADVTCTGSGCATRHQVIRDGLEVLAGGLQLQQQSVIAFPVGGMSLSGQCAVPDAAVDVGSAPISDHYAQLTPGGGTPTAGALQLAAALPEPDGVETFVVLVTDGLPNCNPQNPHEVCTDNSVARQNLCRCQSGASCLGQICAVGCLDDLGVVSASQPFATLDQQLMVITFGADTAGQTSPFSSMSVSLPPLCANDADCRGGGCRPDGTCDSRTFHADTLDDFAKPAARFRDAAQIASRCTWYLSREVATGSLRATVDGNQVSADELTFKGAGRKQRVVFTGAACTALRSSTSVPRFFFLPPAVD